MYLLNRPFFGSLQTCAGERAQFVLIPYPTISFYAEADDVHRSKEEQNRVLAGRVVQWIEDSKRDSEFNETLPTIMLAHLNVCRAELSHSFYKLTEQNDIVFDAGFLPTGWAYIALGHIHKPQCLGGMPHVRYPGSLDRLDFSERDDEKGVVLVDLGETGLRGEPAWLPIAATPMYDVPIADAAAELPTLAERYPDHDSAIVRLRVTHNGAGPSRHEIARELRRLFPRYAEIEWIRPDVPSGDKMIGFKPQSDYRATIRDFLAKELADDRDKEDILRLAEQFLIEEAAS
jgi:exonuclease SbcD